MLFELVPSQRHVHHPTREILRTSPLASKLSAPMRRIVSTTTSPHQFLLSRVSASMFSDLQSGAGAHTGPGVEEWSSEELDPDVGAVRAHQNELARCAARKKAQWKARACVVFVLMTGVRTLESRLPYVAPKPRLVLARLKLVSRGGGFVLG